MGGKTIHKQSMQIQNMYTKNDKSGILQIQYCNSHNEFKI